MALETISPRPAVFRALANVKPWPFWKKMACADHGAQSD
jgi:hypothetical protein